jgi:hypothetical protein
MRCTTLLVLLASVLCLLALCLAACGATAEAPTPLPTAVPPDVMPGGEEEFWAISFKYEFPDETFELGSHRYRLWIHCPVVSAEDTVTAWLPFEVSDRVMPQKEPVYLRLQGLSDAPFVGAYKAGQVIDPDRPVTAIVHLVGLPSQAAALAASSCEGLVLWDNGDRQPLAAGEPFRP